MELRGREVTLRPVEPDDAPALAAILAEPSVARWWGTFDLARVEADLTAGSTPTKTASSSSPTARSSATSRPSRSPNPTSATPASTCSCATAAQGRGLGPDAIRTLAVHLLDDRGHHRLTIDPAADNEAAIRPTRRSVSGRSAHAGLPADARRALGGRTPDGSLADELVR